MRLQERLDEFTGQLIRKRGVHHAVVGVRHIGGAFQYLSASGDAHPDRSPMTPETPFWIASVTKLYIATLVLQLHEREAINIDAPIADYLPTELITNIHRIGGVDHSTRITVRHLLGHASGLPDYFDDAPRGGRSLLEKLEDGDRSWTIPDVIATVRDELEPDFEPLSMDGPGQRVRYSDTNFQLLIALIEEVEGRSFGSVLEERICRPLGLERTFHPADLAEYDSAPATIWMGDQPMHLPLALRSFGDLISTTGEMIDFMTALVRGDLFHDPRTASMMTAHWNVFRFSFRPTAPSWPIEYGLGMMRFRIPRVLSPLRPVPTVVGHTGVSGSWLFHCPELGLIIAGTVGQVAAAATPFRDVPRLLRMIQKDGMA